jgi:hypothetical protein
MKNICVTGFAGSGIKIVRDFLKQITPSDANVEEVTYEEGSLKKDKNQTQIVFVYTNPSITIHRYLSNLSFDKKKFEEITNEWIKVYTEILAFYFRTSQQCILINASAIEYNQDALLKLSKNDFTLKQNLQNFKMSPTVQPPMIGPLLTQSLLDSLQSSANELYEQLESASDLPVPQKDFSFDLKLKSYDASKELVSVNNLNEVKLKHKELVQENELLILQLHQVQEELEYYFQKSQKPEQSNNLKFTEYVIDMSDEVQGSNWHYAEKNGRWAGPLLTSSILLPAIGAGKYTIELHILSVLDIDILSGMTLFVNGRQCHIKSAPNHVPIRLNAEITLTEDDTENPLELVIKFPKALSPHEVSGNEDKRKLAVYFQSIRVSRSKDDRAPLFLVYKNEIESVLKSRKKRIKINPFGFVKKYIPYTRDKYAK